MRIEINYNEQHKIMSSPRPRAAARYGGFAQVYMPKSYLLHKSWLARQVQAQLDASQVFAKFDKERALSIKLLFEFAMPKSWSNRQKQLRAGQYKISKPDIDNLEKTVLDTLNGLLWHDDSQIVTIHSSKRYTSELHDKLTIEVLEIN